MKEKDKPTVDNREEPRDEDITVTPTQNPAVKEETEKTEQLIQQAPEQTQINLEEKKDEQVKQPDKKKEQNPVSIQNKNDKTEDNAEQQSPQQSQTVERQQSTQQQPVEKEEPDSTEMIERINLNQFDSSKLSRLIFEEINELRNTKSSSKCPILWEIASERAKQLTKDFSHNQQDKRSLCAQYEYGQFIDPSEYGEETEGYWAGYSAEAIGKGGIDTSLSYEQLAHQIAEGFKKSSSHWKYLSDSKYKYMAVGVCIKGNQWYVAVLLNKSDLG